MKRTMVTAYRRPVRLQPTGLSRGESGGRELAPCSSQSLPLARTGGRLWPGTGGERLNLCPWVPAFAGMTANCSPYGILFESYFETQGGRSPAKRRSPRTTIPAGKVMFCIRAPWHLAAVPRQARRPKRLRPTGKRHGTGCRLSPREFSVSRRAPLPAWRGIFASLRPSRLQARSAAAAAAPRRPPGPPGQLFSATPRRVFVRPSRAIS